MMTTAMMWAYHPGSRGDSRARGIFFFVIESPFLIVHRFLKQGKSPGAGITSFHAPFCQGTQIPAGPGRCRCTGSRSGSALERPAVFRYVVHPGAEPEHLYPVLHEHLKPLPVPEYPLKVDEHSEGLPDLVQPLQHPVLLAVGRIADDIVALRHSRPEEVLPGPDVPIDDRKTAAGKYPDIFAVLRVKGAPYRGPRPEALHDGIDRIGRRIIFILLIELKLYLCHHALFVKRERRCRSFLPGW